MANLPHGTVTFLFTDIEGSTKLAERLGPAYDAVFEAHQRLLRDAFVRGVEVSTAGDSFFVAFDEASVAVDAAVAGQLALAAHDWPDGVTVAVRMGLHTGEARLGGDDYVGIEVHRAARIAAAGHGGQVLLSATTYAIGGRTLPAGVSVRDLGAHRLSDLSTAEHLFDLVIPGVPAAFPPLASLHDARTNLPTQLTSFVGRDRELEQLRAVVGRHRLVTVIGVGGTGKTRLALQVAADLVPSYPDGVWLVELAALTAPELVTQEVARTLGVPADPSRSIEGALVDFLRRKELLLVLDNCEHVIDAVARLTATLFRDAPSLAVTATSREALGVTGEAVYQVPSMSVPDAAAALDSHHETPSVRRASIAGTEAVRLFVERATAADATFALTDENAEAVAEICRRLDGIPLAIELAAARVNALSPADIAARLEDRFRLLAGGSRTALPRQQTLQALVDWSWELLDEPDRTLLRRLSVFIGGVTVDAVASVTALPELDALEGITRLVDRSLLVADRGSPTRYRMLETIRQYGRDHLVAAGEVEPIRNAHLRYFSDLADRADARIRGPEMIDALRVLDADIENVRAALEWAFDSDPIAALRLSLALATYWRARSMSEGFDQLARAAAWIGERDDDDGTSREHQVLIARVLASAATLSWLVGKAAVGVPWAARSVELAASADDMVARYLALSAQAMGRLFVGERAQVEEASVEAARLASSAGDWYAVALIESGLAQWDAERGNVDAAADRLRRGVAAAERSRNPSVMAFNALSQGRVAGFSGDLAGARVAFGHAIDTYLDMGDHWLALVARSDLAHAMRIAGQLDEAHAIYRETLHAWVHTGNRGAIANQLESFALIAVARDDLVRAATLFGAAEAIREAAGAPMLPYERPMYEAAVARLRGGATGSMDAEWTAGRRMTIDEAGDLALDGRR